MDVIGNEEFGNGGETDNASRVERFTATTLEEFVAFKERFIQRLEREVVLRDRA